MIFILLALIFALLRGQFSLITTLNPFSLKIAQRLTPIVFYILGASILLILDLLAKKGIFSLKLSEYWHQIVRAQINFPSLIYVLGFLLFAFVLAQLIDAKFLLTTYTERESIEEILEITGGILLVIAALLIPYNKKA